MRTTLEIDDDVLSVARSLARRTGGSIGRALSNLARRGLESAGSDSIGEEHGVPVFIVPASTPPITSEMVRDADDCW